jgi:hypothetical protein
MTRYVLPTPAHPVSSPVPVSLYPLLSIIFLGGGIGLAVTLFLYVVTQTKTKRAVSQELTLTVLSAVALAFGSLFLLLWCGVYV